MDEADITNFSTSSSHRLPTVSASQALQDAASRSKGIPSNLSRLDAALRPSIAVTSSIGLPRGQVTEVYGPPGVGKTTLAMQLASNGLHAGSRVVWIDTGAPLPGPRFKQIFNSYSIPAGHDPPSSPPVARSAEELFNNFAYFNVHTLAHLLVLFLHPTARFLPDNTALIVVDNVSAPFATAFPRSVDAKMGSLDLARRNKLQWAASRKWAVTGDLAAAMSKMAALNNIAILAINQVATSLKGVRKAVLKPAISGAAWEAAIHNRLVVWRDFAAPEKEMDQYLANSTRFIRVMKTQGKVKTINSEDAIPFFITKEGLQEIELAISPTVDIQPPVLEETTSTKRKADEISNSEEEGDELGSDDDFGLPDDDLFNEVVLGKGKNELEGRDRPD